MRARIVRHGRLLALVTGLSLTAAGGFAGASPAVSAAGAAKPVHAPTLKQMLHSTGADTNGESDLATSQQAFAAAHYGNMGLSSPYAMSAAIQRAEAQAAAVPTSSAYRKGWTLRGPSSYFANNPNVSGSLTNLGFQNLSGRVTSIATDPNRLGLVWVGTAGGGVWRSYDQGKTWKAMFDKEGAIAIGSVALDPTNSNRVYVGTGEANTNADAYYGDGMYVSDDAGTHWIRVALPGVLTVFHVEVAAPSAGFPKGRVFAATSNGLWLSVDHGRHYRNVSLPTNAAHNGVYRSTPFGNFVTDVRVRPHYPNDVVAVVGWRGGAAKQPNGYAESVGNGFYRSTTGGNVGTFHYVTQNAVTGMGAPGNDPNAVGSSDVIGRTSLAYSADGKYLWAVVQDAGNFRGETFEGVPLPEKNTVLSGVYVSTTADPSTWTPKANSQTFSAAPGTGLLVEQLLLYAPGVQSWYDQWVAVDPNDDNRVLVGLEEIYEAIANPYGPGVATWRTVSRYWNGCAALSAVDCSTIPGPAYAGNATHPDQHAVAFVKAQNNTTLLYTGSDGGIFKQFSHQTDANYNGYDNSGWQYANLGLATTQPYYAVEGSDGTVYAGLQDNGEVKIGPGTSHGDEVFGGDGFDTAVVPGNSNIVYEEYTYGDVSVSTDGGHNWNDIQPCGDATSTTAQFATPFILDPRNPNHIIWVGNNIDESTAGPNTFTTQDPSGEECIGGSWKTSYSLGGSIVSGNAGVTGGGVNNIATAVADDGAAMYVPYCGVCDPITQSTGNFSAFHVGLATNVKSGCTPATGTPACWHKAKLIGLPDRYIQGVAIDPRNHRTVYVALSGYLRRWYPNGVNSGAIYVSYDAGDHFTNISGNLPATPGNAIVLRNGQIFLGTDYGIYTAKQGTKRWTKVGTNLPNASVMDLRLNPDGSQLVAATHGRGVWTYSFGSAAAAPYRQSEGAVGATGGGFNVDPRMPVPGLLLILAAAAVRVPGRRRVGLGGLATA